MSDFTTHLSDIAEALEPVLGRLLTDKASVGEIMRPPPLLAAMRYAVLRGGKRLRPALVVETARLFGCEGDGVLRAAAAVEFLHGYSLVHDDLPAMDDDDLRRGRPTVHRAFDEATAILAGDALQTLAFDILADPATDPDPSVRADLVLGLARASGLGGMAGGQMLDLEAETHRLAEQDIVTLQEMKTGALIRFACEAGPIIAGASSDDIARLSAYGRKIGLAFQLADDLLDLTADAAMLGKAAGKDAAKGKGTLPSLYGEDWTRARLAELVAEAEALLSPFGARADILKAAAHFVANREK